MATFQAAFADAVAPEVDSRAAQVAGYFFGRHTLELHDVRWALEACRISPSAGRLGEIDQGEADQGVPEDTPDRLSSDA
jgi:hypothetical protein